ncbi:MAG: nicotinamide mononucleotide transporter [Nitrospirota bacterium]
MTLFEWALVALSLLGNYWVVKKDRKGYVVWIVSNIGWIAFGLHFRHYGQVAMFGAYTAFSIWGFIRWSKDLSLGSHKNRQGKFLKHEGS